ncbi:ferritin-like domain-containing protein [Archangium violaceum]|uniref:ferritin-like domain-containing protein n=1 Tax=Archangium violaceum TaxID=83451 RepID=UPI001EF0EC4C|nr:ferritin-like domain-containing protein [Archangium violaceum]
MLHYRSHPSCSLHVRQQQRGRGIRLELDLEFGSQKRLNEGIERCRSLADNGSREMLETILEDTEEHIDWREAQLELMKQVGETNSLAQQLKKESCSGRFGASARTALSRSPSEAGVPVRGSRSAALRRQATEVLWLTPAAPCLTCGSPARRWHAGCR